MAKVQGKVEISVDTCKGCELCIESCPQESLAMSKELNALGYHYAVLVQDNCTGCVNCALVCPDAVITVYRTKKDSSNTAATVKEPVAVISRVKGNVTVAVGNIPGREN